MLMETLRLSESNMCFLQEAIVQNGLENRDYGCRGSAALTMRHPQKLELTSPTSGGFSVGMVRSRTKATELVNRCPEILQTIIL
jgi:hypothetical protein